MTAQQIAILTGCIFAAAVIVVLFIYFSNSVLQLTKYRVQSPDIPVGIRIVHLSDLHAKQFGAKGKRLFRLVRAQSPDVICFTGDIIHNYKGGGQDVAAYTISQLVKIAPVYFIAGNHEMRNKHYRDLKKMVADAGAIVLDNECVNVFGINIIGVNGAHLKNATLFRLADGVQGFKLLLAHEPQYIARYAMAGYDLVLSGHAHGGQWRIPFTGIGVYSPGQGIFPRYTQGIHRVGDTRMIVSRGLGNSEFPLRLFNRLEVVVIDLVNG